MEKCGKARQAADGSIKRCMRIVCWITKAAGTRSEYPHGDLACFPSFFGLIQQNVLNDRRHGDDKGAGSSLIGIPLCLRMLVVSPLGIARLKCDGTRAETRFHLSPETDESI